MQAVDFAVLDWIQENLRCGFLDTVLPWLTRLGDGGIIWIALTVALLCIRRYRPVGIMMGISLLAGLLIGNLCLKPLVARPRPCWINTDVNLLIASPGDYSFPSGHTLAAAEASTVALCGDRRIGVPAVILGAVIAFSRLYLYVHFPSDVLAGAVLGTVIGLTVVYIYRKAADRKHRQEEH